MSFRMARDKETSGRKSWGSVDISVGIGASPPVRSGGPEEQRSLASDDSLGPVSNMLLIPRMPPAQYEVSSSLGYTSTRGDSSGAHEMTPTKGWDNVCSTSFLSPSQLLLSCFVILSVRVVREDDGLSAGLQCSREVHGGKC